MVNDNTTFHLYTLYNLYGNCKVVTYIILWSHIWHVNYKMSAVNILTKIECWWLMKDIFIKAPIRNFLMPYFCHTEIFILQRYLMTTMKMMILRVQSEYLPSYIYRYCSPRLNTRLCSPGLNTRLCSPGLNTRLCSPGLNTRLCSPGLNTRLCSPGLNTRLCSPGLNTRLCSPGLNTRLCSPGLNTTGRLFHVCGLWLLLSTNRLAVYNWSALSVYEGALKGWGKSRGLIWYKDVALPVYAGWET